MSIVDEFIELTTPAEPGSEVRLACPLCDWQSSTAVVLDETNGTWHAFNYLGSEYRIHMFEHRPEPIKLVRVNFCLICGSNDRSAVPYRFRSHGPFCDGPFHSS